MQAQRETIIFIILTSALIILLLVMAVLLMLYLYQKRQIAYSNILTRLKSDFEKNLLHSKLEIQEQTFENISREIHDNIGLSLTLAKLHLNAFLQTEESSEGKIEESTSLISKAIADLRHISHNLNSNVIANNGLVKALEDEIMRINKTCLIKAKISVKGEPIFLDNQRELLIFRIAQEGLNNIIKHASASNAVVGLDYSQNELGVSICDDGIGVALDKDIKMGSGILNMKARAKIMNGNFDIASSSLGTTINIKIPITTNDG